MGLVTNYQIEILLAFRTCKQKPCYRTKPRMFLQFTTLIKTKKTVHTCYLSSALLHDVRYRFKLNLFPGETWGTLLQHASPQVLLFSAVEGWLLTHFVCLRAPFQKSLGFFSLNCSAQQLYRAIKPSILLGNSDRNGNSEDLKR